MMECDITCENHEVDGQKVVVSTIVNVFFNKKWKISTASVRKDNVAFLKKQKTDNFFVIFFDNNFVPTLMYVTLPSP